MPNRGSLFPPKFNTGGPSRSCSQSLKDANTRTKRNPSTVEPAKVSLQHSCSKARGPSSVNDAFGGTSLSPSFQQITDFYYFLKKNYRALLNPSCC